MQRNRIIVTDEFVWVWVSNTINLFYKMLGVLKRITPSLSTKASLSSGLLLILDFIYQYLLQCARRIWKARPKHWMCLCNVVQDSILLTSVVIYGLSAMCAEYSEIKVVFWVILSSWSTTSAHANSDRGHRNLSGARRQSRIQTSHSNPCTPILPHICKIGFKKLAF